MADCKLLAFLLCDKATLDQYGGVSLHSPSKPIVIYLPRTRQLPIPGKNAESLYVFYRIVADQYCRIALRVLDPLGVEITGICRDFIEPQQEDASVYQAVWGLGATLFETPGRYVLCLVQETDSAAPITLASTPLFVSRQ